MNQNGNIILGQFVYLLRIHLAFAHTYNSIYMFLVWEKLCLNYGLSTEFVYLNGE